MAGRRGRQSGTDGSRAGPRHFLSGPLGLLPACGPLLSQGTERLFRLFAPPDRRAAAEARSPGRRTDDWTRFPPARSFGSGRSDALVAHRHGAALVEFPRLETALLAALLSGAARPALAAGSVSLPLASRGDLFGFLPVFDPHNAVYFSAFMGLVAFSTTTALVFMRERRRWSARERSLMAEVSNLRSASDRAELLLGAERQFVITWTGRDAEIRFEGDPSVAGEGATARRVLAFGAWLAPGDASAIESALGLRVQAMAAVTGPVIAGQRLSVDFSVVNHGATDLDVSSVDVLAGVGWNIRQTAGNTHGRVAANAAMRGTFALTVPDDAPLTRPYFDRASLNDSRYAVRDAAQAFRPVAEPPLILRVRYTVGDVPLEITSVVQRKEAHLPYGDVLRDVAVVPALAVNVAPRQAIVPIGAHTPIAIHVDLLNNDMEGTTGTVQLRLPDGWTSTPRAMPFAFTRPGERSTFSFAVTASTASVRPYQIGVIATAKGKEYSQGYDTIDHRDLETRYLYHPSTVGVRGIDVAVAPALKVGYVMGIGDDVPMAIGQLGAAVTLLGEPDLAAGDLHRFDAIVTGTRAYAVRDDLKTYSRRLLDYVRDGGNLIVLYNTQELIPNEYAPFPGELTVRAEEVSEEDSPVEILAPADRVLNTPNRITAADFDGWVEQRGSKFWSAWDSAYTPIIATHDTGQPWQRGGWLTATYGKGHYTYFAYALHRQLPYGVPGAYRLLANLLSLGK